MDKVIIKLDPGYQKLFDDIEQTRILSLYRNDKETITIENLLSAIDDLYNYAGRLEERIQEISNETGKDYTWDKYKI